MDSKHGQALRLPGHQLSHRLGHRWCHVHPQWLRWEGQNGAGGCAELEPLPAAGRGGGTVWPRCVGPRHPV